MPTPIDITQEQLDQLGSLLGQVLGKPITLTRVPVLTPDTKETHVCTVLDESSSMGSCKLDTIGAFNSFVDQFEQDKDKGGDTYTSTLVFSSVRGNTWLSKHVPMATAGLAKINTETYRPHGNTPLYDGIDAAITELEQYDTPGGNKAFLVQIFTDGEENDSKITGEILSGRIVEKQNTGRWTFTVSGANINLAALTNTLGIPVNNVQTFTYNPEGIRRMAQAHNKSTSGFMNLRASGATASAGFYGDEPPADPELEKKRRQLEEIERQRQFNIFDAKARALRK